MLGSSSLAFSCLIAVLSCLGSCAIRTSEVPQSTTRNAPEIWATAWRRVPRDCTPLSTMVRLEGEFVPGKANKAPDAVAVARATQAAPPGRAAILWWRYANSLFDFKQDATVGGVATPWATAAGAAVRNEWEQWLRTFAQAGGRLDVLVGDCEQPGKFRMWAMSAQEMDALLKDPRASQPRFGAQPLRGLVQGMDVVKAKSPSTSTDYLIWNKAMGTLTAAAMQESIFLPARAQFPKLIGSNYEGVRMLDRPAPDLNGHAQPEDCIVGTHASPSCYGRIEQIETAWWIDPQDSTKVAKSGNQRFTKTPWNAFLLDVQLARACRRSAPTVPLAPWVAQPAWTGDRGEVPYPIDQRCWDEMVRHVALLGTEYFHYWNPPEAFAKRGGDGIAQRIADQCSQRFASVLRDINSATRGRVVDSASTKPISLGAEVVTTGAKRIDGKWVWRTSVRPGVRALRDRKSRAVVELASNELGRWDVTEEPTPPDYEIAASKDAQPQMQPTGRANPMPAVTPSQ